MKTGSPELMTLNDFIGYVRNLPKAELHLHIEGTLEPSMLMAKAGKHGIELPYSSVEAVEAAYRFSDLQSFLDIYYRGASVLIDEEDFYDLMLAYLQRCWQQGVVHTEIMFDPQTHTARGVGFDVFMPGFLRAMEQASAQWSVSSSLIMSFLRHLPQDDALDTLKLSETYRDDILAVGLDSAESGNPPEKFRDLYSEAALQGYRLTAHAGEEGPPDYIVGALDLLGVERIDHGVRCLESTALVERLVAAQTPLTVCPLSNVRLCVVNEMREHPLLKMLDLGLNVSVNADDPPYFGGYLLENFQALHQAFELTETQVLKLVANSFRGSFLPKQKKQLWLDKLPAG